MGIDDRWRQRMAPQPNAGPGMTPNYLVSRNLPNAANNGGPGVFRKPPPQEDNMRRANFPGWQQPPGRQPQPQPPQQMPAQPPQWQIPAQPPQPVQPWPGPQGPQKPPGFGWQPQPWPGRPPGGPPNAQPMPIGISPFPLQPAPSPFPFQPAPGLGLPPRNPGGLDGLVPPPRTVGPVYPTPPRRRGFYDGPY